MFVIVILFVVGAMVTLLSARALSSTPPHRRPSPPMIDLTPPSVRSRL